MVKPDAGILAFIATNNWVTNFGAKKFREKITREARIEQLIDFGNYKVFRDAAIQTMILIARKSKEKQQYQFDYRRLMGSKPVFAGAEALLQRTIGVGSEYLTPVFDRSRIPSAPLTFSDSALEGVLEKISSRGNFQLDGPTEVAQGIVTPQDNLNAAGCRKLGNKIRVGTGIFIITTEEKNALNLSTPEGELLKPFYGTTELGRYFGSQANTHWIIYTDSSFKKRARIVPYPAIKRHLDQFRKVITSHNGPYGLHRAREEHFFLGQKVIALRKCAEPSFTYTDFPCYVSQTHNVIQTDRINLLYLTGLLNSRLIRFWLKHRGKMQGNHFQVDKEPILAIPIYAPALPDQLRVVNLVQRIIDCLSRMSSARSSAEREQLSRLMSQYEGEMQDIIENLYGLSDEERKMILS